MRIIVLSLVTTYYIALVLCDPDRVRKSSEKIVKSCYNQIDDPYILFSSKTAYRVNQNRDISNLESPKTGILLIFFSCRISVSEFAHYCRM